MKFLLVLLGILLIAARVEAKRSQAVQSGSLEKSEGIKAKKKADPAEAQAQVKKKSLKKSKQKKHASKRRNRSAKKSEAKMKKHRGPVLHESSKKMKIAPPPMSHAPKVDLPAQQGDSLPAPAVTE